MAQTISVTWLGHSAFLLTTPEGKKILIDPWVQGNPACPRDSKNLQQVDLILITHGHGDHIGDAISIAKQFKPKIIGIYEICLWLGSKGVENTSPMNKGGTQSACGVKITMTHAVHSCGIQDGDKIIYGGEACGYVIQFSNGRIFYHAGDTACFSDMALIQELYKPDTAFLPIGDLFTMSPKEAAHACKLLKVGQVAPMHHGTFPILTGTPAALKELLAGSTTKLIDIKPGETKNV
ncbi:MAG: metal-dependent hydrolase [Deltaproteobacteria bacterium RIFCSPLOWO2_01_44_7]|nr:MAG: metal-dependent hydrolase [Deltaproteobacteria bacterium RIFCSPHIGHO2_01_FULL_43_49]OGQ14390.1 MAG: metal-dependent hydrolase [Deltaproteobacteria bacterium RIFCSPHIGHO2_02_FULL_44_53]OGQ27570.1 MAG: metal-dependent hydrolase [Deltaproteobacteria bacterium RIFCSPHIGHO2_12_FULL_44_21]OGQ30831.1 MAG: metal-dependent hydrolase [Deltaproteobacteria bacterium RIFCSPLOWO2_01_FULL_45_74]OGQ37497.1 MAG: metal-dependent hydrolase [Deltaproteobacteria bacterium RIFCSPLOWO2_01_44_7]OGQ42512.1 MAG